MDTLYFENEHVTISWDAVTPCVVVAWHDFMTDADLIFGLEKAMEVLKLHHPRNWLTDARKMKVFSLAFQEYVETEYNPAAMAQGIRRIGLIVAESALAQLALNRMTRDLRDTGLEIAYFDRVEDAKAWFRTPYPTPPES